MSTTNSLKSPTTRAQSAPLLVVVEGNISAGKSTLCRDLAALQGYTVFLEPTVANPFLERYYKDPKKYALPLQMWMLEHRFRCYLDAVKLTWTTSNQGDDTEERPRGILLDRSIFSDWVFAKKNFDDGNISEEGYAKYMNVRNQMLARIPSPDVVVNLNVSPEECYRRVHQERQRACESGIPLAYLQGLSDCYGELVAEFGTKGVHVLDCVSDKFVNCHDVGAQLDAFVRLQEQNGSTPTSVCDEAMRQDILDMITNRPSFGQSPRSRAGADLFEMDMSKIQDAETELNVTERRKNHRELQHEEQDQLHTADTTPSQESTPVAAAGSTKSSSRMHDSPTTIVNSLKVLQDESSTQKLASGPNGDGDLEASAEAAAEVTVS